MGKNTQNKILLVVDRSESSLETVRYVSENSSFKQMELVLFTVFSKVKDFPLDGRLKARCDGIIDELKASEERRQKEIEKYMQNSIQTLIDAGFREDRIILKIRNYGKGFVRQIISEARRGYSCVIIGRNCKEKSQDGMLGYVATMILKTLFSVPLIVVGGNPQQGKVLVAQDASDGAMQAVNFVCTMLAGSEFEVALIHVTRTDEELQKADNEMSGVFDRAKRQLIKSGFSTHQIDSKIITDAQSRAGGVVQEAKQGGYGTIVVGRRGLSKSHKYYMGRVSNKVIQLAREHTVWVVN